MKRISKTSKTLLIFSKDNFTEAKEMLEMVDTDIITIDEKLPKLSKYTSILVFLNTDNLSSLEVTELLGYVGLRDMKKIKFMKSDTVVSFLSMNLSLKQPKFRIGYLKSLMGKTTYRDEFNTSKIISLNASTDYAIINNQPLTIYENLATRASLKIKFNYEMDYVLKHHILAKTDNTVMLSKYLSEQTELVVDALNTHRRVILNSPTGSGKSYLSLQELPKHFENIIILSPYRMITNEHVSDKFISATVKDINSKYISMTLDQFNNFQTGAFKYDFEERIAKADLIIIDEQHVYESSLEFRPKVTDTIDFLTYFEDARILALSGTPLPMPNFHVISTEMVNKPTINYHINPFSKEIDIAKSVQDREGSVLFYCSTKARGQEVANFLSLYTTNRDIALVTSDITSFNGKVCELSYIKEMANDRTIYIGTTKITTGVNLPHLATIYQYGTIYSPSTLIQLIARMRSDGEFFYIEPQHKGQKNDNKLSQAISLANAFTNLNIRTLSSAWTNPHFKQWITNNVQIEEAKTTFEGFAEVYKDAISLLIAKKLAYRLEEHGEFDFIFSNRNINNLKFAFSSTELNLSKNQALLTIVDHINNNISILNNFNLSFIIAESEDPKGSNKRIITPNDAEIKKALNKEITAKAEKTINELMMKLQGVVPMELVNKAFGVAQQEMLTGADLNLNAIKKIRRLDNRVVALQTYIMPKKTIFEIAKDRLLEVGHLTITELDVLVQKTFVTDSNMKTPYRKFLTNLFSTDDFASENFNYSSKKVINGVQYKSVLTLSGAKEKGAYEKILQDILFK